MELMPPVCPECGLQQTFWIPSKQLKVVSALGLQSLAVGAIPLGAFVMSTCLTSQLDRIAVVKLVGLVCVVAGALVSTIHRRALLRKRGLIRPYGSEPWFYKSLAIFAVLAVFLFFVFDAIFPAS